MTGSSGPTQQAGGSCAGLRDSEDMRSTGYQPHPHPEPLRRLAIHRSPSNPTALKKDNSTLRNTACVEAMLSVERRGLEPLTSSLQSCEPPPQQPADAGVYDARPGTTSYSPSGSAPDAPVATPDPDLAALIAAWPDLPEPVRAGINAMVRAATGG